MRLSGHRLTLALSAALVVLMVAGAGAAFAVGRARHGAGAAAGGTSSQITSRSVAVSTSTSPGPTATADQEATRATPPPSAGPASSSAASPPAASAAASSASPGPQAAPAVVLSPAAEASPYGQAVHDLLARYFAAINRRDYDAWLTTVSTSQATRNQDEWTDSYRTTRDSDIYVSDIYPGKPLRVRLQFTSHQAVELAPSAMPRPCVRWDVTYQIIDEGTGLRVGLSAKAPVLAPCQ